MEVIEGQRRNSNIYHASRGFLYHFNTATDEAVYFKCIWYRTQGCRGRAIWMPTDDGGHFMECGAHLHLPDPFLVSEKECRHRILERCRSGEATPFRTILREERNRFPRAVAARITMTRMRNAMFQSRSTICPNIPHTLNELAELLGNPAYEALSMTSDGEANIFNCSVTATDGSVCTIFASPRQIEFLSRAVIIFADGTFCTPAVPEAIQVFNICTTWRWAILPLVHVLMQRRTIPAYRAVIQKLKELNPNFQPPTIMSDFEAAQIRVWREEFPNSDWLGCLFHYMSDVIENAKTFGLTVMLRANPTVSDIVRYLCVIPLAPEHLMRDAYEIVHGMAAATEYFDFLEGVLDYVWTTWLSSVRFLHLSVCNSENRTNNVSESFNRILHEELNNSPHPNIWRFVDALVKIENNMVTDLEVLYDGRSPNRARRGSALANDEAISAWTEDLVNNMITLQQFIMSVSARVINAFNDLVG